MAHLVIAGHGKRRNGTFDPGATGYITKGEHRYVKEDLFPAMKKYLPKKHNVILFDSYNVFDHGSIVALARQYGADEVTEIHFDAASSTASGGHVIIYSGYGPDKTDLAFRDAIKDMVGVRYSHRGHKGISGRNNLANVNRTATAGITYRLLELGFGTNENDAKIMTENVDEYARRLVEVITGKQISKGGDGLSSAEFNTMMKYVESLQKQVTTANAKIETLEKAVFKPERDVSESHKEAWQWAIDEGITIGTNPQNDVTREQLATMLKRFDER